MRASNLTLQNLKRLRKRWKNAPRKDEVKAEAIAKIDQVIARRTSGKPFRSALPKKKQREAGLLPPIFMDEVRNWTKEDEAKAIETL